MKLPSLFFVSIIAFTLCLNQNCIAQEPVQKEKKLIQFSGVVVTGDSLKPVPFTNIFVKGSNHATVSDYYGFFSFAAEEMASITFSAVGFKRASFVIPDTWWSIDHIPHRYQSHVAPGVYN